MLPLETNATHVVIKRIYMIQTNIQNKVFFPHRRHNDYRVSEYLILTTHFALENEKYIYIQEVRDSVFAITFRLP